MIKILLLISILFTSINCFAVNSMDSYQCTKEQAESASKLVEACAKSVDSVGSLCLLYAVATVCDKRK